MRIVKKLLRVPSKIRQLLYTLRHKRPFANNAELGPYIQKNRETLALVSNWIDDKAMAESFFDYGVPDSAKALLNLKINETPSYSDVISKLLSEMREPVNYLEIGVSVGKNFLQMVNALSHATCTGFDIEDISPVLLSRFDPGETIAVWQPPDSSLRKRDSYFKEFRHGTNKVHYLCGDVFDEGAWQKLEGKRFNFIYSDAFHSADALVHEWKMIEKYNLLSQQSFICMWDDLGGDMTDAFAEVAKRIQVNAAPRKPEVMMYEYNGWNGQHEVPHVFGLVRLN